MSLTNLPEVEHEVVDEDDSDQEKPCEIPLLRDSPHNSAPSIKDSNTNDLLDPKLDKFSSKESIEPDGDLTNSTLAEFPDTEKDIVVDPINAGVTIKSLASIQAAEDNSQNIDNDSQNNKRGYRKYLGLIFTVAAALQFALSGMVIKILNYHPFNLGVWRYTLMVLFPIPFLVHATVFKKQKILESFWPMNKTTLMILLQGAVISNSHFLLFYGIQNLNFADCLVISTSAPVFVTLLAYIFLGEACGVLPVFTAVLTLCGVTFIARPPVITGEEDIDGQTLFGVTMGLGSMILLSLSYIIVRSIRTVHHALMNLVFCLWGLIQSLIIGLSTDVISVPSGLSEVGLVILSGLLSFFAQTSLTLALKYEQAGPVALVRTTEVIFAFVLQLIFLGINPDLFSIVGTLFVISGVVLTTVRKMIILLPEDHKYRKMFGILLY